MWEKNLISKWFGCVQKKRILQFLFFFIGFWHAAHFTFSQSKILKCEALHQFNQNSFFLVEIGEFFVFSIRGGEKASSVDQNLTLSNFQFSNFSFFVSVIRDGIDIRPSIGSDSFFFILKKNPIFICRWWCFVRCVVVDLAFLKE